MWRHYVYLHHRCDTEEPFYVGKGTIKKRHKTPIFERASSHRSRNIWWTRIADKCGYRSEIVAMFETDAAAQEFECILISDIGRRDLGKGPLVNVTDGGDGHSGIIVSEGLRVQRSKNASRHRPKSWIESMRRARKGGGNGGVVMTGDTLSSEWRANIAAAKVGKLNPMYGKTGSNHPRSKPVEDVATGDVYESVTAAAHALDIKMKTLHNMLNGFRRNCTSMRFV